MNKTEVELSGEMDFITAQISYAIASMYTEIRKQDKNVGEAFRVSMTRAIASKDSPVWKRTTYDDATCRAALVRKGAKLTGDDIATCCAAARRRTSSRACWRRWKHEHPSEILGFGALQVLQRPAPRLSRGREQHLWRERRRQNQRLRRADVAAFRQGQRRPQPPGHQATGAPAGTMPEVTAILEVDGEPIKLRKVLREKWEKPRGSSIERYAGDTRDYYIDDVPLAENAYKRRIAELIDERQFKLLTDVWAVTKGMHWKDRRTLLAEICGLPEDKQLLATAPQFAELTEKSAAGQWMNTSPC